MTDKTYLSGKKTNEILDYTKTPADELKKKRTPIEKWDNIQSH